MKIIIYFFHNFLINKTILINRWQLAAGKSAEAVKTLEDIAKSNGLPTDNIKQYVTSFIETKKVEKLPKVNIKDLVCTPILRLYTFILWLNWLLTGMSFYGNNQYIGFLGGNIFLNVAFSALLQIFAVFITLYFATKSGRRTSLLIGNAVAAISLIATGI